MSAATESDTRTVHARMLAVLAELPPIGKDQKNVQQNFMFRGHDDVLNALNPLLAKHGVLVVPTVLDRVTSQRSTAKGSVMFEVSLHVQYAFYGAGGDQVVGSVWGEGTDMGDKATSKAMTMAFKSMLNQAFAISNKETADPDSQTADEATSARQEHPPTVAGSSTGASSFSPPANVMPTEAQIGEFKKIALTWKKITPDFDADAAIESAKQNSSVWLGVAQRKLEGYIREAQAAA